MAPRRILGNSFDTEGLLLPQKSGREVRRPRRQTCISSNCKIAVILVILLLLLAFSVIFVDLPLVFLHSAKLQRKVLFMPSEGSSEEFTSLQEHVDGARNFYITVNKTENTTLGVWHFLPEALVNDSIENPNFDYDQSLAQPSYPVLLHFHGNAGNRIYFLKVYLKLRKFFHVIGFDYRGYGDSSKAELTEEGLVKDSVELYKWLRSRAAPNNIYIWGHSLGAAVATHTLARLHHEGIAAMGLILEAPFTTLREEAENFYFAKTFSWLPWFGVTILDGFERSGFYFRTSENILKVDCPIMILHAEDDPLVPHSLGEKLFKIAQEKRDPEIQGNVTFHLFPAKFNYSHWGIPEAFELSKYIRDHLKTCRTFIQEKENADIFTY